MLIPSGAPHPFPPPWSPARTAVSRPRPAAGQTVAHGVLAGGPRRPAGRGRRRGRRRCPSRSGPAGSGSPPTRWCRPPGPCSSTAWSTGAALADRARGLAAGPGPRSSGDLVEVPRRLRRAGPGRGRARPGACTVDEVVERHVGTEFTSASAASRRGSPTSPACPTTWAVPRLTEHAHAGCPPGRSRWPDTWCGIYPTASPGGWRLLGRTDAPLWDVARDEPALLPPGTRVRFVASDERSTVLDPGALTTVQDRGRHGYAHLGVPARGRPRRARPRRWPTGWSATPRTRPCWRPR